METELHLRQIILLLQCLEWWWRDRQDFYAAGNLTIYYSPHQRKAENFRGPDFFVDGQYQELQPNARGWLWSQQLELYFGISESKLRLFTSEEELIPTPEEAATQAEQQVAEMDSLLARYREQFGELP